MIRIVPMEITFPTLFYLLALGKTAFEKIYFYFSLTHYTTLQTGNEQDTIELPGKTWKKDINLLSKNREETLLIFMPPMLYGSLVISWLFTTMP